MPLPFSLSYLIFPPRRVRLPGEARVNVIAQDAPERRSLPARWPTRLLNGAMSLRSFRSTKNRAPPIVDIAPGSSQTSEMGHIMNDDSTIVPDERE